MIPKRIRDRYKMPEIVGPWTDTALIIQRTMRAKGISVTEARLKLRLDQRTFSALIRGVRVPGQLGQYASWGHFIDLPLLMEAIGRDLSRQRDETIFVPKSKSPIVLTVHVEATVGLDNPYRIDYAISTGYGVVRGIWPVRFRTPREARTSLSEVRIALSREFNVN